MGVAPLYIQIWQITCMIPILLGPEHVDKVGVQHPASVSEMALLVLSQ